MIKAAVIGDPISHSLSPKLHRYFLNKYDIEGQYSAINVKPENLERDVVELLENQGFAGFNATIPHKENLFKLCVHKGFDLTESALATETVNTIYRQNDQIWGSNSDSYGFSKNLLNAIKKTNYKTALILGAGGAARCAIFSLLNDFNCEKIYIINRDHTRAQNLVNLYKNLSEKLILIEKIDKNIGNELDLLVNTTPLGMKNQEELKIDLTNLNKNAIIYDIVYNPLMTKLLENAKSRGNPIITGLGMLIFQALEGFEKWFKIKPELNKNDFNELVKILTKNI